MVRKLEIPVKISRKELDELKKKAGASELSSWVRRQLGLPIASRGRPRKVATLPK